MTEQSDLTMRVTELEKRVNTLVERQKAAAHDAAAARVLAGEADRDVSEVRSFRAVTTASFNAMRADLTDLRTKMEDGFARVDARFAKVDERLDKVDERLDKVDERLDKMDGRLDNMDGRLDNMDGRFDKVDSRLDKLDAGQEHLVRLVTRLIDQQQEPSRDQ